ncbi:MULTISPECIES: hypothetical protein [unclassified Streptomyces]|uniref:hypothetical protein n=1 Tax=unclassified Streptomyces TaxID=2593676 RepID=UPI00236640A1|nr:MULTISPECIES: hypothetical protein [unclassified Streptomyces]MDF3140649.1 hypothetical protein [Streptomyces sp. T21Q-yed]WDF39970.1 hypothetical protein PBV52_25850 [Streptomyces sp. T12]
MGQASDDKIRLFRAFRQSLPGAFLVRPTGAAGTDRRRAMNVATAIIHALRAYAHPEAPAAVPHTSTIAKTSEADTRHLLP